MRVRGGGGTCWRVAARVLPTRRRSGARPRVAEAAAGGQLSGSAGRSPGYRYLGPAQARTRGSVPTGSAEAGQPEQRCHYETMPFLFASWATPETGTSPIPRGVQPGERIGRGGVAESPVRDGPSAEASGLSLSEREWVRLPKQPSLSRVPCCRRSPKRPGRIWLFVLFLGAEAPGPGANPISVVPFRAPPCGRPA